MRAPFGSYHHVVAEVVLDGEHHGTCQPVLGCGIGGAGSVSSWEPVGGVPFLIRWVLEVFAAGSVCVEPCGLGFPVVEGGPVQVEAALVGERKGVLCDGGSLRWGGFLHHTVVGVSRLDIGAAPLLERLGDPLSFAQTSAGGELSFELA